MLVKRTAPPRFLETRGARFRLAYNLYGWQIVLVCLLIVPFVVFFGWICVRRGNVPFITVRDNTRRGFTESETSVFHAEILFAAAHRYANEHDGHLPASDTWQAALRPYLTRAGAASALNSFTSPEGTGRFVMNGDLSEAVLNHVPNASRTLLFWQAVTNASALPASASRQSLFGFGGVACDGTAYTLEPTGTASEPLVWRRAERYRSQGRPARSVR